MRALVLTGALLLLACNETLEAASSSCESCHRPLDTPPGIEVPHELFAVACVDCHAGDPDVKTIAGAHIANPGPLDIRNLSRDELGALVPAYRRFINPSDLVSAAVTCGTKGSDGCHQGIVESVDLSVHTTAVGLFSPQRYDQGLMRARTPTVGAVARTANGISLAAIEVPAVPTATASNVRAFQELAIAKDCTGCHLSVYGAEGQGRPQNRFASGCATCHMIYAEDALGTSADPTLNRTEPGHPVAHRLTSVIPDRQCEYCHFRSLRIGTQFRGVREQTALDVELGLPDAKRSDKPLHGHPVGFYVDDDDTKSAGDFTPADVHQQGGLGCVDCHVGQDVHGDGHLRKSMGAETGIECADCHGTFERAITELKTTGGAPLERMRRDPDGKVYLKGALDGRDHLVTQLTDLERSLTIDQAHDTGNHGDLECYACHTGWMQNYWIVERVLDLREMSASPIDGKMTPGKVSETNVVVTLDALLLGQNVDGKIGPFMAKNELLTVIAPCDPRLEPIGCESTPAQPIFGKKIIDRFLGRAIDGSLGLSFVPAFAHTVASKANVRACETCHPRQFEADLARPRAVFGYGRKIMATLTGTTAQVDVSRIIGDDGAAIVPFGVPDTGPVPLRKIQRALNYRVAR